ncbi:MAG: QueT transporter family protein [Lachnospiraceae bacterium]
MKKSKAMYLAQAAMIAALYVVLTYLANALGLANYAIQVRFSEALTILPFFTPYAIPGLFVGCLLANLLTGAILPDIIFGSLTTLVAAFLTYGIRRLAEKKSGNGTYGKITPWLGVIPPIVLNMIVVPLVLAYGYHLEGTIPFFMLTVGAGEVISCGILGMLLFYALRKNATRLFGDFS